MSSTRYNDKLFGSDVRTSYPSCLREMLPSRERTPDPAEAVVLIQGYFPQSSQAKFTVIPKYQMTACALIADR